MPVPGPFGDIGFRVEGHGDSVIGLMMGITVWLVGVINLLTKSP